MASPRPRLRRGPHDHRPPSARNRRRYRDRRAHRRRLVRAPSGHRARRDQRFRITNSSLSRSRRSPQPDPFAQGKLDDVWTLGERFDWPRAFPAAKLVDEQRIAHTCIEPQHAAGEFPRRDPRDLRQRSDEPLQRTVRCAPTRLHGRPPRRSAPRSLQGSWLRHRRRLGSQLGAQGDAPQERIDRRCQRSGFLRNRLELRAEIRLAISQHAAARSTSAEVDSRSCAASRNSSRACDTLS